MPTLDELKILGNELRAKRIANGELSLRKFAAKVGVSHQHLSQIERGYVNPNQGPIVPSDEVLEKIATGLNIPLSRLHSLLGRTPDHPYPAFDDPDAVDLAERYVRLSLPSRQAVREIFLVIERLAASEQSSV